MAELLIELFSEEIPSNLQINARKDLFSNFENLMKKYHVTFNKITVQSSPTRLVLIITGLPTEVVIPSREIKGPRTNISNEILDKFLLSHKAQKKEVYIKEVDKQKFNFIKISSKKIYTENILKENIPKILSEISWKKSMKWSNYSLVWGRPLRSILSIFNNKHLKFSYYHLKSSNIISCINDLKEVRKSINSLKDYKSTLEKNDIIVDHEQRKNIIQKEIDKICKSKSLFQDKDEKLLNEISNIVEKPYIIFINFNKDYLSIPKEIIISTLKVNQKYIPLFDKNKDLTNNFIVVSNKRDRKNFIKIGNKRVVEARLSDAKFFWERDKSKNLIKQINKLKKIAFFDRIGTLYDKTQRLRKLAGYLSDDMKINKEKAEVAASISKSDLCSDLVVEFPELQGKMGEYFAFKQGFDADVAMAVSEHYLPIGFNTPIPKKPISTCVSIVDKIDNLTGFFSINEKPTSSKDPFGLRRSAIGLLRIIIENKVSLRLQDLISYNLRLYGEQNFVSQNKNITKDLLDFLKDRMRNILKEKKIKQDIIEASLSSHHGDNFLDLYNKNFLMNKYINKETGKNAVSSYKRAFNIINKEKNDLKGRPDEILFRKDEERNLFSKICEIREELVSKNNIKDYESLFESFSEIKLLTDHFFDNVVVNDDNNDIKNNRLQLLKMFCDTFNNFINFSKLEGTS